MRRESRMFYRVCDVTLESNIPFPELQPLNDQVEMPDCQFELASDGTPDYGNRDWYHHWRLPSGKTWLSFAKKGSAYLLCFPETADFLISEKANEVKCFAKPQLPFDTIRHLFLDQVIPLVLSHQGKLVLHASAVVAPYGVIAFAGATREGKSTLSASLNRIGYSLITDDCLVLKEEGNQVLAVPSYPGFRLWSDTIPVIYAGECKLSPVAHYSQKSRLDLLDNGLPFNLQPAPLHRIYILMRQQEAVDGDSIKITSPSRRDALIKLLCCTYHLDTTDKESLSQKWDRLIRLSFISGVRVLSYPWDLGLLPAIHEKILEDCAPLLSGSL